MAHYLDNAIKAEYLYKNNKDYIIQGGEVVIVDEQTGRTMPGRRWSDGLHEAVEAKEGVKVQQENATVATVTIQNYFRMYTKLSGMTGTALTEAEEFSKIYTLDVVPIPTHQGMVRDDYNDQIFRSEEAKYRAVVREILGGYVNGRPVLVGTASIENNERLAAYLKAGALRTLALSSVLLTTIRDAKKVPNEIQESFAATLNEPLTEVSLATLRTVATALNLPTDPLAPEMLQRCADMMEITDHARLAQALRDGLSFSILNAKLHEQEATIVAQAGRPGAITIATNMAGRGTDILLGGNPDSLAANYLEQNGVKREQIRVLAKALLDKDEAAARALAASYTGPARRPDEQVSVVTLPPVLVDELKSMREQYDSALKQYEANPALYLLNRYVPGDADTFAERWQFVNDVLAGELGFARDLVNATPGLRQEQIIEIAAARADLESYRAERSEFLATQLFDRIYAARARLIAAVLRGDDEQARQLVAATPTMDIALIDGIKGIKQQVEDDAEAVRQRGGLHIIGTERHEARRIDNQLRGRAGRQGDPGSSRFYISLEDELMRRFGPSIDRVKGIMARAGFEDDLPLEFGIISKQIENAQTKVEGYNFDIRKRVVDYDDVMNKQREVIYARRRAILVEGEEQRRITMLINRYLAGYADWATGQVEELAASTTAAEEINAQLARVLPGAEALDRAALLAANETERAALLQPLIEQAFADHHPLRLLLDDVSEFIELDVEPAFEQLKAGDRAAVEQLIDSAWRAGHEGDIEERVKDLFIGQLDILRERYLDNYETWLISEIRDTVDAATTQATNTLNVEGALRRLAPKLPAVATLNPQEFSRLTPEVLIRQLETMIRPSREEGNHLRLFARDLLNLLPFLPNTSAEIFLQQFGENIFSILTVLPEPERVQRVNELLAPVTAALGPILAGQDFTDEQGERFQHAIEQAWMDVLDHAAALPDDAVDQGLEQLVETYFVRWRGLIGVELLHRYTRELMLSAIDREWVDYLTAVEDLRQGIGLQGLAQRDPLVSYKTQAFKMFEELLETIDTTTVRQFFVALPNWMGQMQAQQAYGQAARQRDVRVGPNEPCPCGSGKKFKKCHGAAQRPAAPAATPVVAQPSTAAGAPAKPAAAAAPAGQGRSKGKGRNVPRR